jgi:elongation factor Ts
MSTIPASAVKTLRDRTNQPMMDCKSALIEACGDMEKAVDILRKRSKDVVDKKVGRETAEGRIAVYVDTNKKVGAILEMRCESPPVVNNEHFVALANDLARQAALQSATTVEALLSQSYIGDPKKTVKDHIDETVGLIRENMKPARFTNLHGLVGSYVHHDGAVGVLVQVEGAQADPQMLRDVCMHITARNPSYALRENVPAETVAKEQEIARSQISADPKNANKPPQIIEKIAEGKMKTWFAENVLVEQPFVRDDSKTVGELLKSAGLKLTRFVRYKVGELA